MGPLPVVAGDPVGAGARLRRHLLGAAVPAARVAGVGGAGVWRGPRCRGVRCCAFAFLSSSCGALRGDQMLTGL